MTSLMSFPCLHLVSKPILEGCRGEQWVQNSDTEQVPYRYRTDPGPIYVFWYNNRFHVFPIIGIQ